MITAELITYLRNSYRLEWDGCHGSPHWARVKKNGDLIADNEPGINRRVVQLFSFWHDHERHNEWEDRNHGPRAAQMAKNLNGVLFDFNDIELDQLVTACAGHTGGRANSVTDPTVLCCWDADRLDIGRIGLKPHPSYLSLPFSKQSAVIEAAYMRSISERWK